MTMTYKRKTLLCGCAGCGPMGGFASTAVSRRSFLAGSAAVGLGMTGLMTAGLGSAAAEPAGNDQTLTSRFRFDKPHRIDVHHHIVPPAQRKMNIERHGGKGGPAWSVQASLDDMDKAGVAYSLTSILNPGPWYGKIEEPSRRLARECNDYAAKLRSDHPNRFGIFAAIAPVDTEGSLKEIAYAYDTLKVEGIALWTSYDGKYLGNEAFVPVLEELNRRRAVVYVHPTPAECCAKVIDVVPPSAIEYATDTTRTVASLIFEKPRSAVKFPDIRWIWSHSGGTIPFLTSRFSRLAWERKMDDPVPIMQKHFYEIAQGNTPGQLAALMKLVSISQVMFGSDYPFREAKEALDGMVAFKFSAADQLAIENGNALKMFPNIKI